MNFFTRISLSTPAFALVALAMAPGCVLDTKVGGNPVDGSDTDGSASETGETETEGPDPSETETEGPDPSETETEGPDPSETDTEGPTHPFCEAPNPKATASVAVEFGDWPSDMGTSSEEKHISAGDCTVESATSLSGVIDIALRCSEGELVDRPIALHVTGPATFNVDLVAGEVVKLAALWRGDGIDIVGGSWLILRGANDLLLFAGLDLDTADKPQASLTPLTIVVDEDACEPTCENGCTVPEWDTVERQGLVFTHESGPGVELVDESRGELLAGGELYDIVVAHAEVWSCINCGPRYRWILRQGYQE
jgi:hypothetical protein